jgi:hypothetical protein
MLNITGEHLVDIEQIKQLQARYCLEVDRKNWAVLRSLFVDDAVYRRGDGPNVLEAKGADALVDSLRKAVPETPTAHYVHMPVFERLDAQDAEVIWSSEWLQSQGMHGLGFYRNGYHKVDGAWKISRLVFDVFWVEAPFIPGHYDRSKVYLVPRSIPAGAGS